ncbi:hypothetical protein HDU98_002684 [Podochytrium sp. JEL0797]|nr:hypothetical protein HDU98_002684 [Podochytrium sp. JEL0797]
MHDDDFVLVLLGLCFFGDCGAVEKWIPRLYEKNKNRTSFPFCFASQALVDAAKLGHVAIVDMLLGRFDLDFEVENPLHSRVDVAGAGSLENDRLLVIECVEENHLRWDAL